jgi:hypothetical protein
MHLRTCGSFKSENHKKKYWVRKSLLDANNVETPETEGVSITAGPQQQQNANNSMSAENRRDASYSRDAKNSRWKHQEQ